MAQEVRRHRIAVIAGDGIGIEVTAVALKVRRAIQEHLSGSTLDFDELDYGSARYKAKGAYTPEGWLKNLETFDAIFFGAVGDPDVPDHISLWDLILPMRQAFQQYANVRPSAILPGIPARISGLQIGDLDWIIVRENTEGEYAGQGGRSHQGTKHEIATEVAVFTRDGIERIMRVTGDLGGSLSTSDVATIVCKYISSSEM